MRNIVWRLFVFLSIGSSDKAVLYHLIDHNVSSVESRHRKSSWIINISFQHPNQHRRFDHIQPVKQRLARLRLSVVSSWLCSSSCGSLRSIFFIAERNIARSSVASIWQKLSKSIKLIFPRSAALAGRTGRIRSELPARSGSSRSALRETADHLAAAPPGWRPSRSAQNADRHPRPRKQADQLLRSAAGSSVSHRARN